MDKLADFIEDESTRARVVKLRVTDQELDALDDAAAHHGTSRSSIIRAALRAAGVLSFGAPSNAPSENERARSSATDLGTVAARIAAACEPADTEAGNG